MYPEGDGEIVGARVWTEGYRITHQDRVRRPIENLAARADRAEVRSENADHIVGSDAWYDSPGYLRQGGRTCHRLNNRVRTDRDNLGRARTGRTAGPVYGITDADSERPA